MNNLNTQKTINRVDFKIEASGYGVVNWNGPTTYYLPEKNECANNIILPKLDNFTTTTERVNKNGEKYQSYKTLDEIEFELSKHDLYISENCIKRNLFKDELITSTELTSKNSEKVLQSVYGLIRGYVVTKGKGSTSYVRAGVLHLEPFTDTLRNGNIQSYSQDRKSTRLNSSHVRISYAVFCLKKKNNQHQQVRRNAAAHTGSANASTPVPNITIMTPSASTILLPPIITIIIHTTTLHNLQHNI